MLYDQIIYMQKLALGVTANSVYEALSEMLRYWKRKTGSDGIPVENDEQRYSDTDNNSNVSVEVVKRLITCIDFVCYFSDCIVYFVQNLLINGKEIFSSAILQKYFQS